MLKRIAVLSLLAAIPVGSAFAAGSDEKPFKEGPVTEVTRIRTADGKFMDYMNYLNGTWRAEHEAEKKAGLILEYHVYTITPRSPDDANLILTVTFPNFAAFDKQAEFEAIAQKVEGSQKEQDKGFADRGSIRKVLGSMLTQELILK
jgi:hypothetical protein